LWDKWAYSERSCLEWRKAYDCLETELERTRKALEIAWDALKHYCTDSDNWSCVIDFTGDYDNTPSEFADKALEQITAILENKNVNC
jgi:hypothetical protein